jgi:hypothetical protein
LKSKFESGEYQTSSTIIETLYNLVVPILHWILSRAGWETGKFTTDFEYLIGRIENEKRVGRALADCPDPKNGRGVYLLRKS